MSTNAIILIILGLVVLVILIVLALTAVGYKVLVKDNDKADLTSPTNELIRDDGFPDVFYSYQGIQLCALFLSVCDSHMKNNKRFSRLYKRTQHHHTRT